MESSESNKPDADAKKANNKKPDIAWCRAFTKNLQNCIIAQDLATFNSSIKEFIRLLKKEVSNSVIKRLRIRPFFMLKHLNNCLILYSMLYKQLGEMVDQTLYTVRMMEIMPLYLDLEMLSFGTQLYNINDVTARAITIFKLFLDSNQILACEVLLHTTTHWTPNDFGKSNKLLTNLFKRLLNDMTHVPMNDVEYVQYILTYRLWKIVENDVCERVIINNECINKLQISDEMRVRRTLVNMFPPNTPVKNVNKMLVIELDLFQVIQNFLKYVSLLREKSIPRYEIICDDIYEISPSQSTSSPSLNYNTFDDPMNNFPHDELGCTMEMPTADDVVSRVMADMQNFAQHSNHIRSTENIRQNNFAQNQSSSLLRRSKHSPANEIISVDSDDEDGEETSRHVNPLLKNLKMDDSLKEFVASIVKDTASSFIRQTRERLGLLSLSSLKRMRQMKSETLCIDLDEESESEQPVQSSFNVPSVTSKIDAAVQISVEDSVQSSSTNVTVQVAPSADESAPDRSNLTGDSSMQNQVQEVNVEDKRIKKPIENKSEVIVDVSLATVMTTPMSEGYVGTRSTIDSEGTINTQISTQTEDIVTTSTKDMDQMESNNVPELFSDLESTIQVQSDNTENTKIVVTTPELINTCMSMLAKDQTSKTTALITSSQTIQQIPVESNLESVDSTTNRAEISNPDLMLKEILTPKKNSVVDETLPLFNSTPNVESNASISMDRTIRTANEVLKEGAQSNSGESMTHSPKVLESLDDDEPQKSDMSSLLDPQDDVTLNVSKSPKTYIDKGKELSKKNLRETKVSGGKHDKSVSLSKSISDSIESNTSSIQNNSSNQSKTHRRNSFLTPAQLKCMSNDDSIPKCVDADADTTTISEKEPRSISSDKNKDLVGTIKVIKAASEPIFGESSSRLDSSVKSCDEISPSPECDDRISPLMGSPRIGSSESRKQIVNKRRKGKPSGDLDNINSPNYEEFSSDEKQIVIPYFAQSRKTAPKNQNVTSTTNSSHYMVRQQADNASTTQEVKNKHVPIANVMPQYKSVHFPNDVGGAPNNKVSLHKVEKESDIQFRLNFYNPGTNSASGNNNSTSKNYHRYTPNRRDMNQSKSAINQQLQSTSTVNNSSTAAASTRIPSTAHVETRSSPTFIEQSAGHRMGGNTYNSSYYRGSFMQNKPSDNPMYFRSLDHTNYNNSISKSTESVLSKQGHTFHSNSNSSIGSRDKLPSVSSRSRSTSRASSQPRQVRSKSQTKNTRSRSQNKSPVRSRSHSRISTSRCSTRNRDKILAASSEERGPKNFTYIAPLNGGKVSFYVRDPSINYSTVYNIDNKHNPFIQLQNILCNLPNDLSIGIPPHVVKANVSKTLAKMPPDKIKKTSPKRKKRSTKRLAKPLQPENVPVSEEIIETTAIWKTPLQQNNPKCVDKATKKLNFEKEMKSRSHLSKLKQTASQLLRKRPMEKIEIDNNKALTKNTDKPRRKTSLGKNLMAILDEDGDMYDDEDEIFNIMNYEEDIGQNHSIIEDDILEKHEKLIRISETTFGQSEDTRKSEICTSSKYNKNAGKKNHRLVECSITQDDMLNSSVEKKDILSKLRKRVNRTKSLCSFDKPIVHIVGDEIDMIHVESSSKNIIQDTLNNKILDPLKKHVKNMIRAPDEVIDKPQFSDKMVSKGKNISEALKMDVIETQLSNHQEINGDCSTIQGTEAINLKPNSRDKNSLPVNVEDNDIMKREKVASARCLLPKCDIVDTENIVVMPTRSPECVRILEVESNVQKELIEVIDLPEISNIIEIGEDIEVPEICGIEEIVETMHIPKKIEGKSHIIEEENISLEYVKNLLELEKDIHQSDKNIGQDHKIQGKAVKSVNKINDLTRSLEKSNDIEKSKKVDDCEIGNEIKKDGHVDNGKSEIVKIKSVNSAIKSSLKRKEELVQISKKNREKDDIKPVDSSKELDSHNTKSNDNLNHKYSKSEKPIGSTEKKSSKMAFKTETSQTEKSLTNTATDPKPKEIIEQATTKDIEIKNDKTDLTTRKLQMSDDDKPKTAAEILDSWRNSQKILERKNSSRVSNLIADPKNFDLARNSDALRESQKSINLHVEKPTEEILIKRDVFKIPRTTIIQDHENLQVKQEYKGNMTIPSQKMHSNIVDNHNNEKNEESILNKIYTSDTSQVSSIDNSSKETVGSNSPKNQFILDCSIEKNIDESIIDSFHSNESLEDNTTTLYTISRLLPATDEIMPLKDSDSIKCQVPTKDKIDRKINKPQKKDITDCSAKVCRKKGSSMPNDKKSLQDCKKSVNLSNEINNDDYVTDKTINKNNVLYHKTDKGININDKEIKKIATKGPVLGEAGENKIENKSVSCRNISKTSVNDVNNSSIEEHNVKVIRNSVDKDALITKADVSNKHIGCISKSAGELGRNVKTPGQLKYIPSDVQYQTSNLGQKLLTDIETDRLFNHSDKQVHHMTNDNKNKCEISKNISIDNVSDPLKFESSCQKLKSKGKFKNEENIHKTDHDSALANEVILLNQQALKNRKEAKRKKKIDQNNEMKNVIQAQHNPNLTGECNSIKNHNNKLDNLPSSENISTISRNVARKRKPYTRIYLTDDYAKPDKYKFLPKLPKISCRVDLSTVVEKLSKKLMSTEIEKDIADAKYITNSLPATRTPAKTIRNHKQSSRKTNIKEVKTNISQVSCKISDIPINDNKTENKNKRRLGMSIVVKPANKKQKVLENVTGNMSNKSKVKTRRKNNASDHFKNETGISKKHMKAISSDAAELMYSDDSLGSNYFPNNFSPNINDDMVYREDSSPEQLIIEIEEKDNKEKLSDNTSLNAMTLNDTDIRNFII